MPHTIRRLPGVPIIVITYKEPFDYTMLNFETIFKEVGKQAEGIEGTIYNINDASGLKLNFSTVVKALTNALFRPMSVYPGGERTVTVVVGKGMLFDIAQKAAGRKQHGELAMLVFETLEEALEDIRNRLKKS